MYESYWINTYRYTCRGYKKAMIMFAVKTCKRHFDRLYLQPFPLFPLFPLATNFGPKIKFSNLLHYKTRF